MAAAYSKQLEHKGIFWAKGICKPKEGGKGKRLAGDQHAESSVRRGPTTSRKEEPERLEKWLQVQEVSPQGGHRICSERRPYAAASLSEPGDWDPKMGHLQHLYWGPRCRKSQH